MIWPKIEPEILSCILFPYTFYPICISLLFYVESAQLFGSMQHYSAPGSDVSAPYGDGGGGGTMEGVTRHVCILLACTS